MDLKGQFVLSLEVFKTRGSRLQISQAHVVILEEEGAVSVIVTESAVSGCKTLKSDLWNCIKMWNVHTRVCSGWRPVTPQSRNEAPGCCQYLAAVSCQ